MGEKKSISALVSGGEANAGPPLGPAMGPMGVNVLQVVNTINEKTKDFPGMKVPVKVEVDTETKKFTVEVGIPPTALGGKGGRDSKGLRHLWHQLCRRSVDGKCCQNSQDED